MDKPKKIYYGDSHRKLRRKINALIEDLNPELEKELMRIILKYQRTKTISKEDIEIIKKWIYKILEEVYKLTSSELRKIYREIKELDIKDILDLTFKSDGKTLDERIEEYLEELAERYDVHYNKTNDAFEAASLTFIYLKSKFDRIILTESYHMESSVKKIKKPVRASMLIIEAGCGDLCQGGEYSADENVDLPPFHPNCQCIWYFDETDDLDEIEDLELEIEE